jgi:hypothetical protein
MPFPRVNFCIPKIFPISGDGKYIAPILSAFDFPSTYIVLMRRRYRAPHGQSGFLEHLYPRLTTDYNSAAKNTRIRVET